MPGFEVVGSEERDQVLDVFQNGGVLFRHGFEDRRRGSFKVREFESKFSEFLGSPFCLAVSSGTAALRVALAALRIEPGDEVITQAFTFVATVEAIIESGAQPVIAEIDETMNLDPASLASLIGPRTKAVIAVHMLGTPANLKAIEEVTNRSGVALLEDVAWGCGGRLAGKPLGTWGRMGCFSFDHAKAITTGEGGMIAFRDESDFRTAAAWHDHGHENNPGLARWEDSRSSSGFNFRMSELQGAVGIAQLSKLPRIVESQRSSRDAIVEAVSDLHGVVVRPKPESSFETADGLVFLLPDPAAALATRVELLANGIGTKILPEATTWHFAAHWDHMPELVSRHGPLGEAFPVSRGLLERAVSIPVLIGQSEEVPGLVRKSLETVLGLS